MMILVAACEGEDDALRQQDEPRYLPLVTGAYQLYDVHEKRYYASAQVEEVQYRLKAEVIDSFPSGIDAYTYVVHRSIRTGDEPWQALDTWSVRSAENEFVVSEGATPFVKLKLPYKSDNRWNGNTYNTLGVDEYGYGPIGLPKELNGMRFENTLEVLQEFNQDPIVFRDERKEIYATDVGLIYKEVIQLHYCTDDACLGLQKIDEGTEMKMVITGYGKL